MSTKRITNSEKASNGLTKHSNTPRHEIEKRLKEGEERYRSLIHVSSQIVWTANTQGQMTGDTASWCAYTGQRKDDLNATTILQVIHPEDRERATQSWTQSLSTQSPYEVECRLRRSDGVYRIFTVRAVPVFGDNGKIREWVGTCSDITERRQLEEQVRASERQRQIMFEQAAIGIAYVGIDGRWLHVNQKLCTITGYSREELQKRKFQDITHPADLAHSLTQLHRLLSGEISTYSLEKRYFRKDGSLVWVNATISLVCDNHNLPDYLMAFIEDISVRKEVEERELARTQQFTTIFETITDGLYVYDAQGYIIQTNEAVHKIFGIEPGSNYLSLSTAMRGQITLTRNEQGKLLPEDALPASRILRGEIFQGANAMDVIIRSLDGRDVHLSISGAPLRDSTGQIIGGVSVMRDVTERRLLEQQAHEAASRAAAHVSELEAIFEAMTDALLVYDSQGQIIFASPAAQEFFPSDVWPDHQSQPLQERTSHYMLRDEKGQPLTDQQSPILRLLRGEVLKGANALDVILRARDGRELQVNLGGSPMRDMAGQILGAVVIAHDVTERRRLEKRTHDALEGLLAMAEALVQLPENIGGIENVGHKLAELTCNILDCQRVGVMQVEPETEIVRPITVVGLSPEQEHDWWEEQRGRESSLKESSTPQIIERLRNKEVVVIDMTQPPFNRGPNPYDVKVMLIAPMCIGERLGGFLTLDYRGEDHSYTPAEIALASAIAKLAALVFERQRLLHERAEAQSRELALRESNRRMEEFLGIASHELRTPLTTIKANIQLAMRRLNTLQQSSALFLPESNSKITAAYDMLSRAERQVGVLNRLVGDMIDISRIQTGRMQVHLRQESVNLIEIVQEVVEEQRKAHNGRVILLHVPPLTHISVIADPDRIAQVLTNYLTNALKYSLSEKPVEVRVELADQQTRVSVRDQGPGLDQAEQQQIWECFYQAQNVKVLSGSGVGLGLGLYISKTIIERHNGSVGVESIPGQGSTFWFALPLITKGIQEKSRS